MYCLGIVADRLGGEDLARAHPPTTGGDPAGQTLKCKRSISTKRWIQSSQRTRVSRATPTRLFARRSTSRRKLVGKESRGAIRHVSGQELLNGIRQFALQQFGPMVVTVFEEWGVKSCRDFGEIVFNMVEIGLLAKTDKDTRDDFQNGYDFTDAFAKPFWPQSKLKTEKKPVAR